MSKQFKHVALGGTFDLFHIGHKEFIKKAFDLADFVSIGIVSNKFAAELGKSPVQNFYTRKSAILSHLKKTVIDDKYKIVELNNIYGETLTDRTIDCLLVTNETISGAQEINKKRYKIGLNALELINVSYKKTNGLRISSSLIRKGILAPNGLNYQEFLTKNNFLLPFKMRKTLSKPFGKVLSSVSLKRGANTITVGDETTHQFVKNKIIPDLSIVDLKINRVKKFETIKDIGLNEITNVKTALNPPGNITAELSNAVSILLRAGQKSAIVVNGEEDLATIPAVLLSPIRSTVYYGIREMGIIEIPVNLEAKDLFLSILKKFKKRTVELSKYS